MDGSKKGGTTSAELPTVSVPEVCLQGGCSQSSHTSQQGEAGKGDGVPEGLGRAVGLSPNSSPSRQSASWFCKCQLCGVLPTITQNFPGIVSCLMLGLPAHWVPPADSKVLGSRSTHRSRQSIRSVPTAQGHQSAVNQINVVEQGHMQLGFSVCVSHAANSAG